MTQIFRQSFILKKVRENLVGFRKRARLGKRKTLQVEGRVL